MGRRQTYARGEITAQAMRLFWERGYHATSTRDLTDAMGVNPYSLYAEFGSKEALYEHTIELYMETVVSGHFSRLEAHDADLDDVRAVLDWFGDNGTRENSDLGCFVCNTSTERAPTVEASQVTAARFVHRVATAFAHALEQAVAAGQLVRTTPVDALAAAFTTHLIGVFVLSRAGVDPAVHRSAADMELARIAAFIPAG